MEGREEMTIIPSDEEFARAKKVMADESRHLDRVVRSIKQCFSKRCALYDFYLLPQLDVTFRACAFFDTNADLESSRVNGIIDEIIEYTYVELERAGRGKRDEITVAFEFDSDENVREKYNGDYFLRLR